MKTTNFELLKKQMAYIEFKMKEYPGDPFVMKVAEVSQKIDQLETEMNRIEFELVKLQAEQHRREEELLKDSYENATDDLITEIRNTPH